MHKSIVIKFLMTCFFLIFSQLATASSHILPHKDCKGFLEVVIFSTNKGYSDTQIIKRADAVTSLLKSYPGFLSRQFSKNVIKKNEWVDIVHWSSLHDALMAAKKIVKTHQMKKFMAVMQSYKMYHFQVKLTFPCPSLPKNGCYLH